MVSVTSLGSVSMLGLPAACPVLKGDKAVGQEGQGGVMGVMDMG